MLAERGDADFQPPAENQQFARVTRNRGNNLHEVEPACMPIDPSDQTADEVFDISTQAPIATTFLASMPNKFRKNIWVKRGSFVIIEMIAEGNKVKAEISKILLPEHVRQFRKDGIWPTKFDDHRQQSKDATEAAVNAEQKQKTEKKPGNESESDDDSDDDSDLVRNTNGWRATAGQSDDSEEDSDEDDDEETDDQHEDDDEKQENENVAQGGSLSK